MYVLSFLFTLHISLSAYVNSTFLTGIVSEKYVGLLYTIGAIITIFLLSRSATLLKYFGNRKLVLWLLIINMVSIACLITSPNPKLIGLSFISILTTNTLIALCLDIFIEHFGNPKTIGKTRGLYLTVTNLAWMLSPLVTALLIARNGGYITVYALALITVVIMTIGLSLSVKTFTDKKYIREPFIKTYRYLKTHPHIFAITMINFILQFFFTWMVIYTPIFLKQHIGFNWGELGVIFTIMLAPFVIFGLPIGILVDKYHVKKRTLLYIGFIIIVASTISIAFIDVKNIALWALVLFLTRTGASIIETTSEIYFFTHVGEEDAYLLGIFRDMTPVAYIVGPLCATLVFTVLPFNYLFIVLGIILMLGLYYIPQLKHEHRIPDQNQ